MGKKRVRTTRTVGPGIAPATTAHRVPARNEIVDAARGAAIAMMIAYHVCFDLTYFGWADWPMLDDWRWIAWRSTIVTSFLLLVGVSLALRDAHAPSAPWFDRGFVRRWLQIAGAALAVTAGSAALFPETFIYFGVLHFVAVALWLCRRASRAPWPALVAAAVVLVAGLCLHDATFDPKAIDWLGFAADKPRTEDYVPLFPWLGVVLIGCGLGGLWTRRGALASRRLPIALRGFAHAGRWSLTIYLVHQPLLIGAMAAVKRLL
jgi:uncharacterized membrane protein